MPDAESLCPYCLRRIAARRIVAGDEVYLKKSCPEHGELEKVLIWRNHPIPLDVWTRSRAGSCCSSSCDCHETPVDDAAAPLNCPYDCGICSGHQQRTCSAIIEVTARCNLRCPVCFADSPGSGSDPTIHEIERILQNVRRSAGNCPIQLSGGEPTLRDDLCEIIHRARAIGFDHIQVNTNGLRLARDFDYAKKLQSAGVTDFFLQFDGVTDDVYRALRGKELFVLKEAAIRTAAELKIAVILVPTLVKGVNDTQIGDIIQFAKTQMPAVKGVHFQPMTSAGRYPRAPRNDDRVLIPDVIAAVCEQTAGEFIPENFIPSACEHALCSFSALAVLREDGCLIPSTHIDWTFSRGKDDAAKKSIAYVRRHWKYPEQTAAPSAEKSAANESGSISAAASGNAAKPVVSISAVEIPRANPHTDSNITLDDFMERVRNYSLCVSGMAFQDVWNIEIDRLRRCCIHVATPDSALIPFCARYLTGANGQKLNHGAPR